MTVGARFLEDMAPNERPKRQIKFDWQLAADKLRRRPWHWAVLREDAPRSTITQMRRGDYAAFRPPSDFEFTTTSTHERRRVVLYARFIAAPMPDDLEELPRP
jgi:hypothetical protein